MQSKSQDDVTAAHQQGTKHNQVAPCNSGVQLGVNDVVGAPAGGYPQSNCYSNSYQPGQPNIFIVGQQPAVRVHII